MLDLVFVRDRGSRRETKLLNVLLMIKSTLWKGRTAQLPNYSCYCCLPGGSRARRWLANFIVR